jgi:hypothetical protein
MLNEKPSTIKNMGEDVMGAARHRNDTYDVERERVKQEKKARDNWKKQRKAQLEAEGFTESAHITFEIDSLIHDFECLMGCSDLKTMANVINKIIENKGMERDRLLVLVKAFRKTEKRIRKIKYLAQFYPDELKPKSKDMFHEVSGVSEQWGSAKGAVGLPFNVRAVQFGNSVPDGERAFCVNELGMALGQLATLGGKVPTVLQGLAYAFGARGRKGSLAHFERGSNVLNVNRGVFGCLVHEVGHAIHNGLDCPRSVSAKYFEKVKENKNRNYYMKPGEIWARAFEAYVNHKLEYKLSRWAFIDMGMLPEVDSELIQWVEGVLYASETKCA